MNFVKRAILSVITRKGKAFVILAIFFIVANLVLAGFAIQSATQKAGDLARQKLGGSVTLQPDMEKIMNSQQSANGQMGQRGMRLKMPPLSEKDAQQLTSLDHVRAYNYLSNAPAVANGFNPVETDDSASGDSAQGTRMVIGGMAIGIQPNIMLNGVRTTDLLEGFNNGTDKIVEGRGIQPSDAGKSVAVIEKQLAEANELKVGDKIKVDGAREGSVAELDIVGIYQTTNTSDMAGMAVTNPSNTIYAPYTVVSPLKANGEEGQFNLNSAVYYLDDPKNIESFKEAAQKTSVDFDTYMLDANDSVYQQMMGPIENVASFSNLIIYLVTIAGSVILGLIVMSSIKERRYEMGVLLSIGEKRIKLVGQFLTEILVVAMLAFGLSVFTGNAIAQAAGDKLVQQEIATAKEQEAQQPMQRMIRMGPGAPQQNIDAEPIDQLDVSVTPAEMGKFALVGLLIAMVATLIPSISIMRLHPKMILTKSD
ncbi:ABC transporter permease [Paenactinomyces guangxiensis]|uniref:ABC transporter permease n=1 Tax=Paenactinomyces guangxiensis TaxID=1490290 RepID=A0A7W2AAP2_9BACL|nr:ABC transporter permease [Paenactinomyces guangxiensis]MBA4496098.1 ABC transporter permease [Paenactinomyces guangxiensis]MBH8593185.1 ABC transporter permease [Paenactinomyces guangxiensis]